jgi:cytochrome oxidase Cu insertion factor (SCO1/SenC/PrrC family)
LVDANGHRTGLAAWPGKTVVLADFLTFCQEICPMTSANFAQMAAAADHAELSRQVEFVELTVDPARYRPPDSRRTRTMFAAKPNWTLLTSTKPAITATWKQFGSTAERRRSPNPQHRTGGPVRRSATT